LLLTSNPSVGPAGDGPCGLAVRFSVGLAGSFHLDRSASRPCIAGPAGCSSPDTRSRDRPGGAPLVRFCAPSAFASHAASSSGRSGDATHRTMPLRRWSAGTVGLASEPRGAAAGPSAHAVFRSSAATGPKTGGCWGPRNPRPPSARVMRRLDSSEATFRYPYPKRVARPGVSAFVPAALMGFVPSQCCSCPRGFRGRCPPRRIPLAVSRTSAPIIFAGGSAVPLRNSI